MNLANLAQAAAVLYSPILGNAVRGMNAMHPQSEADKQRIAANTQAVLAPYAQQQALLNAAVGNPQQSQLPQRMLAGAGRVMSEGNPLLLNAAANFARGYMANDPNDANRTLNAFSAITGQRPITTADIAEQQRLRAVMDRGSKRTYPNAQPTRSTNARNGAAVTSAARADTATPPVQQAVQQPVQPMQQPISGYNGRYITQRQQMSEPYVSPTFAVEDGQLSEQTAHDYAQLLNAGVYPQLSQAAANARNLVAAKYAQAEVLANKLGDAANYARVQNDPETANAANRAIAQGVNPNVAIANAIIGGNFANGNYRNAANAYLTQYLPAADKANDANTALAMQLGVPVAPQTDFTGNAASSSMMNGITPNNGQAVINLNGGNTISGVPLSYTATAATQLGNNAINGANLAMQGEYARQQQLLREQADANARAKNAQEAVNANAKTNSQALRDRAALYKLFGVDKSDTGTLTPAQKIKLMEYAARNGLSPEEALSSFMTLQAGGE